MKLRQILRYLGVTTSDQISDSEMPPSAAKTPTTVQLFCPAQPVADVEAGELRCAPRPTITSLRPQLEGPALDDLHLRRGRANAAGCDAAHRHVGVGAGRALRADRR